ESRTPADLREEEGECKRAQKHGVEKRPYLVDRFDERAKMFGILGENYGHTAPGGGKNSGDGQIVPVCGFGAEMTPINIHDADGRKRIEFTGTGRQGGRHDDADHQSDETRRKILCYEGKKDVVRIIESGAVVRFLEQLNSGFTRRRHFFLRRAIFT